MPYTCLQSAPVAAPEVIREKANELVRAAVRLVYKHVQEQLLPYTMEYVFLRRYSESWNQNHKGVCPVEWFRHPPRMVT